MSILIFHRVFPAPDPVFPGEPDAKWFERMLACVGQWFNVLPLDEAVAMLGDARLPERAAAITFDDGYADNRSIALPILRRHRMSATVFIATGFLDGGRMWNDTVVEAVRRSAASDLDLRELDLGRLRIASAEEKRTAIERILPAIKYRDIMKRSELAERVAALAGVVPPSDLMMRSEDVLELARSGMQIGAHTVSHPILATLDVAAAEAEIRDSRIALEGILGARIGLFAYPNGKPGADYTAKDVEIVRRLGFDAAVSTRPAPAAGGDSRFELPRFTPWDKPLWRFGARLARSLAQS